MSDYETVKAMRDANWKPAVTYWKEKCDQADATIARLTAERDAARAAGFAQGIEAAAERIDREISNRQAQLSREGSALSDLKRPSVKYAIRRADLDARVSCRDAIRALVPQPEADLETCSDCEGTGIAGHPDSGYTCTKCSGCGGVQPEADPVRDAALAAGRAQGIEAALAVVTEEARRQLWHARHVCNDTKTRERASSAWSALDIAAQTIRALAPQPEADPVREAAEKLLKTIWFDGPGATDIINMDKVNALRRALAQKGGE